MRGLANSFKGLLASYPQITQITQITQNEASHKESPKPTKGFPNSLVPFVLFSGSFPIFHAYLRNLRNLRIRSDASLCYTPSARLVGQSARQNAPQSKYQAVNG